MRETPFDLDKDFDSGEELMDSLDKVMMKIASDISKDEADTTMIAMEGVQQVKTAYKALRFITNGKDVDVIYELNKPYTSMGSISIIGKEIIITSPKMFARVAEMASNFEVYPKTDGTVQMNFTFHNLTRKVGN